MQGHKSPDGIKHISGTGLLSSGVPHCIGEYRCEADLAGETNQTSRTGSAQNDFATARSIASTVADTIGCTMSHCFDDKITSTEHLNPWRHNALCDIGTTYCQCTSEFRCRTKHGHHTTGHWSLGHMPQQLSNSDDRFTAFALKVGI